MLRTGAAEAAFKEKWLVKHDDSCTLTCVKVTQGDIKNERHVKRDVKGSEKGKADQIMDKEREGLQPSPPAASSRD